MTEYRAIYKCRLCGGEFAQGITTSEDVILQNMINLVTKCGIKQNIGVPVTETYMHNCKDGSYGFADFIGFRKMEDRNESD